MTRTSCALLALLALATASSAQTPAAIPAPPDVAAPPADAAKTASGLVSRIVTPGSGSEKPTDTDVVTVQYTGWTAEGTMFDSSRARSAPSMFPLNRVMAGWRECVQLMSVGETRRCWLPPALAYRGQAGRPTGTVVFDIELVDTRRSPTIPPPDVAAPPSDATRTVSGLLYKTLKDGTGVRRPGPRDRVLVHYTGWTTDGKMFDSTVAKGMPATLDLNDVIRGWTEGLQLMVEGDRMRFWIPQDLAYKGEAGAPRGMLVFEIDLIKIQ
ncbi:MAG: FKBP-type peptidyl-prolyl cis-trans isomerase [Acidobacteria bacterium]|nr:FKBP-type peptidyl-prolyl cis-trans isomerase [Acidobacteriota bacterium]